MQQLISLLTANGNCCLLTACLTNIWRASHEKALRYGNILTIFDMILILYSVAF
jgi:hypothetical protein